MNDTEIQKLRGELKHLRPGTGAYNNTRAEICALERGARPRAETKTIQQLTAMEALDVLLVHAKRDFSADGLDAVADKVRSALEPDKHWFIVKMGVYVHGVYGPYESSDAALKAFSEAYGAPDTTDDSWPPSPFDGHHDYHLVTALPDVVGEEMELSNDTRVPYTPKQQEERNE